MSADTLRRAAKLMRERAEAASTGEPWEADKHYDSSWLIDLKPSLGPVTDPEPGAVWFESLDPFGAGQDDPRFLQAVSPRAQHIASWHPLVALAVADWLDVKAANLDAAEATAGVSKDHDWGYALAVARAYLGEQS